MYWQVFPFCKRLTIWDESWISTQVLLFDEEFFQILAPWWICWKCWLKRDLITSRGISTKLENTPLWTISWIPTGSNWPRLCHAGSRRTWWLWWDFVPSWWPMLCPVGCHQVSKRLRLGGWWCVPPALYSSIKPWMPWMASRHVARAVALLWDNSLITAAIA